MHRNALVDYANGIVRDRARAEDVVQEAWERLQAVERGRSLSEPLRYFYRIVRNLALDGYRLQRREASHIKDDGGVTEKVADELPSAEEGVIAQQELRQLVEALNALPERTRQVLLMHSVEGMKIREIADRLGISLGLAHKLVVQGKAHCAKWVGRRS